MDDIGICSEAVVSVGASSTEDAVGVFPLFDSEAWTLDPRESVERTEDPPVREGRTEKVAIDGITKDERCVCDGLIETVPSEDGGTPADVPTVSEGRWTAEVPCDAGISGPVEVPGNAMLPLDEAVS